MPFTKHIFTYVQVEGDTKVKHDISVGPSPSMDLDIVEIQLRGHPSDTIREEVVIQRGAFVVLKLSFDRLEKKTDAPSHIDFIIEGINDAGLVYSDSGVYPYNLDETVPVFDDLSDPAVRSRIRGAESFVAYIEETPKVGQERIKHFKL
jgi:hypothetical protein